MAIKEKLWTISPIGLPNRDCKLGERQILVDGHPLDNGREFIFVSQGKRGTLIIKDGDCPMAVDLYPEKTGLSLRWARFKTDLFIRTVIWLDGLLPDPRGRD